MSANNTQQRTRKRNSITGFVVATHERTGIRNAKGVAMAIFKNTVAAAELVVDSDVVLANSDCAEDFDGANGGDVGMPLTATPYQIVDAPSARAAVDLPRGTKVALAISGIDSEVAARDQFRINALLSECGCSVSAAVLVASVSAAIAIDVLDWTVLRESPATIVGGELLLAFVASGIGRFIGIAIARKKLRILLSSIGDRIDDQLRRRTPWAA